MILRTILTILGLVLATAPQAETQVPQSRAEIALSFAPLVEKAAPAVVNIYARRVIDAQQSPFMGDPFFEDFFRAFGAPRPRVQNSLGSGVILGADGIVVSNYHVVGMATDIRVILTDRREYAARVLLGDRESDLAILQLEDAEGLPFVPLRDSDHISVGELVLAIGNPFGVGQTVTSGIVSGLARSGAATGNARGYFIQTDAAINPGNSGGALIDTTGSLIGVNTSILSRSGGSNGIGFAIPANLVAQFVAQAREGQTAFQRPWAGLAGQPVDAGLAASLGLTIPEGIIVSDLHDASPFAAQGLRVGDVITEVGGRPVNSPSEMLFRMSATGIGTETIVEVYRDGEPLELVVAMIVPPDDPPSVPVVLGEDSVLRGLTIARANPRVIARFGLPLNVDGVVVTETGELGARAGLQAGDIVMAINGTRLEKPDDVAAALAGSGRRLRIDLLRRGQQIALRFRL